jgi:succinate dehydrogenase/fumarate reductase-like Fe-S protein
MYAVQYSNRALAVDTLASIDAGRGLDACRNCESCSASCRSHVNIGRKIEQLKELRLQPVLA